MQNIKERYTQNKPYKIHIKLLFAWVSLILEIILYKQANIHLFILTKR